jgi:hypothetical protein
MLRRLSRKEKSRREHLAIYRISNQIGDFRGELGGRKAEALYAKTRAIAHFL